ncbi:hypothetical protein FIBSPDRAFT_928377 [Athelia psychrophila]|uniref:WW domain-containing protein n=1 Tax=Athelia psychrophila TaxID=1759441 RepID=A0A166QB19_9AGAM|nr:hypothetical protein FIBSPDRAFT_928377 [Fibularhizoctonia sp. CBS 109695]
MATLDLKPLRFVLRLLHYLISLAGGSIKGLLALIGWTYRRLARNRDKHFRGCSLTPSDTECTEPPSNQHTSCPSAIPRVEHDFTDVRYGAKSSKAPEDPPSHLPPVHSHDEYVCPSFAPRAEHVTLDIPLQDHVDDNGGPYPTTVHSPSQTFFSGQGSIYAGSRSSRAISIEETSGSDTRSVNSRGSRQSGARETNAASAPSIPVLPISTHGLQMISAGPGMRISQSSASPMPSRPASSNSQNSDPPGEPIKISSPMPPPRQLTPPPSPIATPIGGSISRSSSPENGLTIMPMSTATVQRWNRGVKISTEFNHCLVGPFNFEFKDNSPPEGWAACQHPEGALYFFHAEKRVFTDVLMYNPEKATIVNEAANQILGKIHQNALDEEAVLPKEYDLVIELVELYCETVVGYYFANHASRLLFWMEEFDAWRICCEITCVVSFSHLHTLTSQTSTTAWLKEDNKILLDVLDRICDPSELACDRAHSGAIIEHNHFLHLHGQHGSRLDIGQTVHGTITKPRTRSFQIMEAFLFWGSMSHLRALENIWVDRFVHANSWKAFIGNLEKQWGELSIASVDNGGLDVSHRSPTQILIYTSTVTSLSSMLFALFLLKQNRPKGQGPVETAARFLGNMTHDSTTGLENLAIMYALPYALLIWSTLEFLAAFLFYCFHNTSTPTCVTVASALGGCMALVAWYSTRLWIGESNGRYYLQRLSQWMRTMFIALWSKMRPWRADGSNESFRRGKFRGSPPVGTCQKVVQVATSPSFAAQHRMQAIAYNMPPSDNAEFSPNELQN